MTIWTENLKKIECGDLFTGPAKLVGIVEEIVGRVAQLSLFWWLQIDPNIFQVDVDYNSTIVIVNPFVVQTEVLFHRKVSGQVF